jgi:quercetin dioxygenase-like cupin family protein
MDLSRRDLSILLPLLAQAQSKLESKCYVYDELKEKVSGENRSRNYFNGVTTRGLGIELHETELAPGKAPHGEHKHVYEEMLFLREGLMEVTIEGKSTRLMPGSVAFVASNEMHGWRNVGETRARYFVFTLGR